MYMVMLDKSLGIRFAFSLDGKVFVHALQKGGNAEKSRTIMVGDTLKKAGESSGGRLIEIKDFGDTESFTKEKSGSCSLVLERPFSPFPIHQLHLMNDLDILFIRGRVPIATWNKSIPASNLRASSEGGGNSGLQLKMDGEELTEQETALYDRQICVWGADAQRRLSKSHILISGLKGTVIEELDKSTLECMRVQERNMALAKELAAIKLYRSLLESKISQFIVMKLASLGNDAGSREMVDVLRKSVVIRNKSFEILIIKSRMLL